MVIPNATPGWPVLAESGLGGLALFCGSGSPPFYGARSLSAQVWPLIFVLRPAQESCCAGILAFPWGMFSQSFGYVWPGRAGTDRPYG